MKMTIVRASHFSCGYAFQVPGYSSAENLKTYGDLANYEGFGRNFRVEASFSGEIDPLSGMILNLTEIDQWLGHVVSSLDHRFLNTDLKYFSKCVPTPENIVKYIFEEITAQMILHKDVCLTNVRLYESENRWLDFGVGPFENE